MQKGGYGRWVLLIIFDGHLDAFNYRPLSLCTDMLSTLEGKE
jgi:hypothetical protein